MGLNRNNSVGMKSLKVVCCICRYEADISVMYPTGWGFVCQGCISDYRRIQLNRTKKKR